MKVGENLRELDLIAAHRNRTVCALTLPPLNIRQVLGINREEPANAGVLQLETSCCAVGAVQMDRAGSHSSKDPGQHVEEMHAYVGGDSSRLGNLALPTGVIPMP